MGTDTIAKAPIGQTSAAHANATLDALLEDIVPRGTDGAPNASTENAGSPTLPFGSIYTENLYIDGDLFSVAAVSSQKNRLISSDTRTTSRQPLALVPAGVGNGLSVTVLGAAVDLVFDVNGTQYTLTADITKSSLTAAPSSSNTALINNIYEATGTHSSRLYGENYEPSGYDDSGAKTPMEIDTAGSAITGLVGTFQAFELNGEIFFAFVRSSTRLSNCYRGFFIDENGDPINRATCANNDTVTLYSINWIFLNSDLSTVTATITNPVWSYVEPASPSTGDFWYDFNASAWKTYNGAAFVSANSFLLGLAVCDDTDCIAARTLDFWHIPRSDSTIEIEKVSASIARIKNPRSRAFVYGGNVQFGFSLQSFDMSTHLADASDLYDATEQASRNYYFYLSDLGEAKISDIEPYYRPDLGGLYHPHNTWLCVGFGKNDSSSDFSECGWFAQNQLLAENDFLLCVNDAASTWNTTGSSVHVPMGTAVDSGGSAIRLSGGYVKFNKRSRYRVNCFMQLKSGNATLVECVATFNNFTVGHSMGLTEGAKKEGRNNSNFQVYFRGIIDVRNIEDDYGIGFFTTQAYTGNRVHVLIERLPTLGI